MRALPKLGVGLAYQAPLAPLFAAPDAGIDFVEVVPDMFWTDHGPGGAPRYIDDDAGIARLRQLAGARPVVAHSIGLSIGSADRYDAQHVAQVAHWRRRLDFPWHSDHLAFHLADHGGHRANVGITLPLARDAETLALLAPRLRAVQRAIPRPFLLENNTYYFDIPDSEMDEARFLNRLCREGGCGLLLDLHNLHTNARNHGFDAMDLLRELDLSHVGELHVAGGMVLDGVYLDAHSDVVAEAVWPLLEWALPRCPNLGGVVFELFGSWVEAVGLSPVRADLRRLQALWRRAQCRRGPAMHAARPAAAAAGAAP